MVACIWPAFAAEARSQDVRLLLIRPVNAKVLPAEAARAFKQAITEAGSVAFVASMAEATDIIELTSYEWKVDGASGVSETWQFSHLHFPEPDDPPAARARPNLFFVMAEGKTLSESTQAGQEKLRDVLRPLLARFHPVVPR
jgi:hypothetical protein